MGRRLSTMPRKIGRVTRWSPPAASGIAPASLTRVKNCSMCASVSAMSHGLTGHVAEIGDPGQVIGRGPRHRVDPPHQAGLVADRAGAVAGAGAVGGPAVPRHADQADVDGRRVGGIGQPHECRDAGKPRQDNARNRLDRPGVIHVHPSRRRASRRENYTRWAAIAETIRKPGRFATRRRRRPARWRLPLPVSACAGYAGGQAWLTISTA